MRGRRPETQRRTWKSLMLQGRPAWVTLVIALVVLGVAGVTGVLTGNWLSDNQKASDEYSHVDEFLGLGERTGLTGELGLNVNPMKISVRAGQPVRVKLTLDNRTSRTLLLNGWLTSSPADFESNQFPFKVNVYKQGRKIIPLGNPLLRPPHDKDDFFRLRRDQKREVSMEIYPGDQRWDLSTPGDYTVEILYETYLTGKHIGVNAWTGSTNHVIVQVQVY